MYKLSVLIPTLPNRFEVFSNLMFDLKFQLQALDKTNDVEIITDDSIYKSIGEKRNYLLNLVNGEYVCFIDDDDKVSDDYFKTIFSAIENKPDNLSLKGIITIDGQLPKYFEHSIKYNEYKTTQNLITYERYPNHLNVIKTEIAKKFKFPETNFGEDTDWATQIKDSGLLKKETYIDKILYYYRYISNK